MTDLVADLAGVDGIEEAKLEALVNMLIQCEGSEDHDEESGQFGFQHNGLRVYIRKIEQNTENETA